MSVGFCDMENGQAGIVREGDTVLDWQAGNIDADPLFVRNPNDGGDGWGVGDNDDYGNLHLRWTSPCIDAGDPAGDYTGQVDIDGQPRVLGGRVDVGADEFDPNNIPPSVVSYALSDDTGVSHSDQITSDTTPVLTFVFSEVTDGTNDAVRVTKPSGGEVVPDSISGWGTNTLTVSFTSPLPEDGQYSLTLSGSSTITDAAGQPLNGGVDEVRHFTLDTTAPVVVDAIPSLTMIEAANAGVPDGTPGQGFVVRVTFNESMNWLTDHPVVTFSPDVTLPPGTLTYDAARSWWINDTTFRAGFDVADANVYVPQVGIGVAGGQDAAGNVQTPYQRTDDFTINTLTTPVTVTRVVPFVTKVTGTNTGNDGLPGNANAGFSARVFYSGSMDISPISRPTVTFTTDTGGTVVSDPAQSWWVNATTYRAGFDVVDTDAVVTADGFKVSGGRDDGGYLPDRFSGPDVFVIDMTTSQPLPNAVLIRPTLALVSDRNIGADQFQFRLTYDKAMNTDTTPVIQFSPDVADTLAFDPSQSWWVSDRVYKAVYNVADANVIHSNVAASVVPIDPVTLRTGRGTWSAITRPPSRSTTSSASTRWTRRRRWPIPSPLRSTARIRRLRCIR